MICGNPIKVVKMHSLHNIILVIPPDQNTVWDRAAIMAISNFQTGIGADQVMLCLDRPNPENASKSLGISIWNRDGSSALACGNGMRCVVASLNTPVNEIVTLHGPVGPVHGWKMPDNAIAIAQGAVTISLDSSALESDQALPKTRFFVESINQWIEGIPAHIGNPHVIVLGQVPHNLPETWLAHNAHFPHGVNVSFVWPKSDHISCDFSENTTDWIGETFNVKTWERGIGLSKGCGSAACAIGAVLWYVQKQTHPYDRKDPKYTLLMPGGTLHLWLQGDTWVHSAPTCTIAKCDWWM